MTIVIPRRTGTAVKATPASGADAATASPEPVRAADARQQSGTALPLPKLPTLVSRDVAPQATPNEVAAAKPATGEVLPAPSSSDAEARAELRRASDRAGLGDFERERILEATALLDGGDTATALANLRDMNRELDLASQTYTVKPGETLRQIAGYIEVYGNSEMWPLIWRSNMASGKQPRQLRANLVLEIPSFPSLDEVSSALKYAKANAVQGRTPAVDAAP